MNIKKLHPYAFYTLLAVAALGTIFVNLVMPFLGNGHQVNSQSATSAEHDSTNSDGHHNGNSEDLGNIVDLTAQQSVTMDIQDFKYEQPNIKIKKGTTVTWTNRDSVKHNVMMDHNDSGSAHDAPSAAEVKDDVLAGPLLAAGESYSFTFNEATSSPYHCSPHPYMKGSVTVVE